MPAEEEEEEEEGGGMGKKAEGEGKEESRLLSSSFFFFFGGVMIHLFVTKTERKNEGRRTGPGRRAFLPPLLFSFTHGGAPPPSVIYMLTKGGEDERARTLNCLEIGRRKKKEEN